MREAKIALRLGLSFVFLYASVSAFLSPNDWIWYIPDWIQKIAPAILLLHIHSATELILGIWLLIGWKSFFSAVFAAADLLVINLFNISILSVVFLDIGF